MLLTTMYGLKKPQDTDVADLKVFIGENMDLIEAALQNQVKSVNGYFGDVGLTSADIEDANEGQTLDLVIEQLYYYLNQRALTNSPSLTGVPRAPTAPQADVSTQIANTAYVNSMLNTLYIWDENQGQSIMETFDSIEWNKAGKTSPAFLGTPTAPTPATADNSTKIATTAFVKNQGYAPLSSPTFTTLATAPRFVSTQANGTPPLTVTSGTMVANLNAERTNGIKIFTQSAQPTSPNINDIWLW
jgi:hypothetical protein